MFLPAALALSKRCRQARPDRKSHRRVGLVHVITIAIVSSATALGAGFLAPAYAGGDPWGSSTREKRPTPPPVPVTVYQPSGKGPFPAVVVLHGGGFIGGSREANAFQCALLMADGYVAIAADYSLAPPGGASHFPAPVNDAMDVIAWARNNAFRYHIDPTNVGVLGTSAGGTIADSAGIMGTKGSTRPDAVVALSAVTDLVTDYNLAKPLPSGFSSAELLTAYIGCTPSQCPSSWNQASPLTSARRGDAPTLIINGSNELVPLADPLEYSRRLKSVAVAEEIVIVPGFQHGSQLTDDSWPRVMAFLDFYLK
jgi:acetyl esterase